MGRSPNPSSLNSRGLVLAKLGRHEEAVNDFTSAISLHNTSSRPQSNTTDTTSSSMNEGTSKFMSGFLFNRGFSLKNIGFLFLESTYFKKLNMFYLFKNSIH